MRKSIRRRHRVAQMNDVTLTPLIDTALTLLIIFMVTTPMMNNAIKVELPKGNAQEAAKTQQEFIVYIDSREQIFFNSNPVSKEQLIADLNSSIGQNKKSDQVVFVNADQAVRYGYVLDIVDQIKFVENVQSVALSTKKRA